MVTLALIVGLVLFAGIGIYMTLGSGSKPRVFGGGDGHGADAPDQRRE